MNYRISELRNKNVHTTKATLQRSGVTLDLVVYPGETVPEDMTALADNITLVDDSGAEIARIKSLTGETWDKRSQARPAD